MGITTLSTDVLAYGIISILQVIMEDLPVVVVRKLQLLLTVMQGNVGNIRSVIRSVRWCVNGQLRDTTRHIRPAVREDS